jgi:hypothetical protein
MEIRTVTNRVPFNPLYRNRGLLGICTKYILLEAGLDEPARA